MKIQADNYNGILEVKEFDDRVEILSEDTFYVCLKDNPDGTTIGADVSQAVYNKIEKEYGIK